MNKGALIANVESITGFTVGKLYKVLAGLGDGNIARSDGCVGGFITSDTQCCIKDDDGEIRLVSSRKFKLVRDVPNTNPIRVPVTHMYTPRKNGFIAQAVMGEFSHADASGFGSN